MFSKLSYTPRMRRAVRRARIRAQEETAMAAMSAAMAPAPPSPREFSFSPPLASYTPPPSPEIHDAKRKRPMLFLEVPPAQPSPVPPPADVPSSSPPVCTSPLSPADEDVVLRTPTPLQGVFRPIEPDDTVRPALMPARVRPRVIPPTPPPIAPPTPGPLIVLDKEPTEAEVFAMVERRSPFERIRSIVRCRKGGFVWKLVQLAVDNSDWVKDDEYIIDYVDLTSDDQ